MAILRWAEFYESSDANNQSDGSKALTSDDEARLAFHLACRHPELVDLIEAWPSLPDAVRAGVMAMVKAAK